jgi:DNA-binding MarR family transcriptional regulator
VVDEADGSGDSGRADLDVVRAFGVADDLIARITVLRRTSAYRALLARGTGLDGRVTTMRVLRAVSDIRRSGAAASVDAVAQRLLMAHSNASRAVDQAVAQGLLVKRQSAIDGRRVELEPSERGWRAVTELNVRRGAVHAQLVAGWTSEEVETLAGLLQRLGDAVEDVLARDGTEARAVQNVEDW